MFVRTLLVTTCLSASLAVAGVATAGGFKVPTSLGPIPGLTTTTLPVICQVHIEGRVLLADCHATTLNPTPPKDEKSITLRGGGTSLEITAYPDGEVTLFVRASLGK